MKTSGNETELSSNVFERVYLGVDKVLVQVPYVHAIVSRAGVNNPCGLKKGPQKKKTRRKRRNDVPRISRADDGKKKDGSLLPG